MKLCQILHDFFEKSFKFLAIFLKKWAIFNEILSNFGRFLRKITKFLAIFDLFKSMSDNLRNFFQILHDCFEKSFNFCDFFEKLSDF